MCQGNWEVIMGDITEQIGHLKAATINELVEHYKQLFGQKPPVWTKVVLIRQLAHKIQEQTLGGISPAAKTRIQELIRRCTFRGHIT